MSPDGYRSEGTPSLSEGPDARGERFFAYFFLALVKKVSRRKGETISCRYRSNGYVHGQQKAGRLSGRHRWQASSHRRAKTKAKAAYTHALHHSSGRALARLQLLILIHPPPREAERRCSSGEGRAAPFDAVEHAACRSKRSRPEGSVPGWIPERRNAEPKRGAGRKGRAFFCLLFFGACKKSESP